MKLMNFNNFEVSYKPTSHRWSKHTLSDLIIKIKFDTTITDDFCPIKGLLTKNRKNA